MRHLPQESWGSRYLSKLVSIIVNYVIAQNNHSSFDKTTQHKALEFTDSPCNLPMALFIDMKEVQNTLVMFMDIRNITL